MGLRRKSKGASTRSGEQELFARSAQQSTVADIGKLALAHIAPVEMMAEVARGIAAALPADFVQVLEYLPDSSIFARRAESGWVESDAPGRTEQDTSDSHAGYTIATGGPVLVEDLRAERRFQGLATLAANGFTHGLTTIVPGARRPFGVIGVYSRDKPRWVAHDIQFLQTIANLLACCIEREKSEAALTKSVRELATVKYALDQASIVAITDRAGVITYANRKFCEISKYSEAELLGQNHRIVNSGHHPREFFKDMWATILRGDVWRGEIRNRAKDGSNYWVDTTIVPLSDEHGKPIQFIAIRNDLTEKKRLEAELTRASQLSLIGELAAGLAHEIKNPLAGIQGTVDILIRRRAADDPEREALENVRHEVARIDGTVRALLERARPRPVHPEHASLTNAVRRAVAIARDHALYASRHGLSQVSLEFEAGPEELMTWMDPTQIEDAVLNLLLNAIEASDPGQPVVVRVFAERGAGSDDGDAVVEVVDRGRGIAPEFLGKIFQPFFTMTPGGTGLGLPAVRRIARAHGGRLNVESKIGTGSTFSLRLPLRNKDPHGV